MGGYIRWWTTGCLSRLMLMLRQIPFDNFILTNTGELVQHQITMYRERVRTVGISLLGGNSGVSGPYDLGIHSIRAVNEEDVTKPPCECVHDCPCMARLTHFSSREESIAWCMTSSILITRYSSVDRHIRITYIYKGTYEWPTKRKRKKRINQEKAPEVPVNPTTKQRHNQSSIPHGHHCLILWSHRIRQVRCLSWP